MHTPNWRRLLLSDLARLRWVVFVAGIASLASVACVTEVREFGVVPLGVADDGSIVAMAYEEQETGYYGSVDGGLTWKRLYHPATSSTPDPSLAEWRDSRDDIMDTSRGRYTLDGPDVIRVALDGRRQIAYSTSYLLEDGNTWIQQYATNSLSSRRALASEPIDLVFDEMSGNLVLTMGILGVVVGTPGGEWVEVDVGRFRPADFTFAAKTLMLLTHLGFWLTALTLAFSIMCNPNMAGCRLPF